MKPTLHARTLACSFRCFLPAPDWLAWVGLVGAGLEIVASSAVALGREHVIGRLTDWKVAGPELQYRVLARMLRPFGVESRGIRVGERTPKGYDRDGFELAFSRYLAV